MKYRSDQEWKDFLDTVGARTIDETLSSIPQAKAIHDFTELWVDCPCCQNKFIPFRSMESWKVNVLLMLDDFRLPSIIKYILTLWKLENRGLIKSDYELKERHPLLRGVVRK